MFVELRTKLMMRDENQQISAAEDIMLRIRQIQGSMKKKLVDDFLRFNIGHALCDVLGTSNEKLSSLVLNCLSALSASLSFFENDLATLAIEKIITMSFALLQKRSLYEKILFKLLDTVEVLLMAAVAQQVDLLTVCDAGRIMEYLNEYEAVGAHFGMRSKMSSARVFKQIAPFIGAPFDEKSAEAVRKGFQDHLKCMEQIIEVRKNLNCPFTITAIKSICEISGRAVWFCSMIREGYNSGVCLIDPRKSLHDALILSLTSISSKCIEKFAIPHFRFLNPLSRTFISTREAFLGYLTQLLDLPTLRDVATLEISKSLATNGYLMYLFEEGRTQVLQDMNWLPLTTAQILSHVLTNLAVEEGSLTIDVIPGDVSDFRMGLCKGLLTAMESRQLALSSSLLTLIYFHQKATKEKAEIRFEAIVEKILGKEERWSVPEVKVLWYFLAKLMLKERERPKQLSEAVLKVFQVVMSFGVERCFLDDVEVVKSALGHPLGHEIREKVLEMWIRRRGNVDALWDSFTQENLMFCLWKLIQTAPENFVPQIQGAMESLIHRKSVAEDMKKFLIPRIFDILAEFRDERSSNLVAILSLFLSVSDDVPREIGVRCAPNIIRIFTEETSNPQAKHSLLQFTWKILESADRQADGKAAKVFVKPNFVKAIYAEGFSHEMEDRLSAICLKVLTILLSGQEKYQLGAQGGVMMEEMDLYTPLRRREIVSLEAVKLVAIVLGEMVEDPILKVPKFSSEAQQEAIVFGIYDRVIALHEMCRPESWPIFYTCLVSILTFSLRRKLKKTLALCCDTSAHFFMVFYAIENQDTSPEFFSFIYFWLATSLALPTDNVLIAMRCREKNTNNGFYPRLPFSKTLEILDGYINHLKNENKVDRSLLNSLKTLLDKVT